MTRRSSTLEDAAVGYGGRALLDGRRSVAIARRRLPRRGRPERRRQDDAPPVAPRRAAARRGAARPPAAAAGRLRPAARARGHDLAVHRRRGRADGARPGARAARAGRAPRTARWSAGRWRASGSSTSPRAVRRALRRAAAADAHRPRARGRARSCSRSTSRRTGWIPAAELATMDLLRELHEGSALAIVMVSHRLETVANYARTLAFVDKDAGALPGRGRSTRCSGPTRSARSTAAPVAVREENGRRLVYPARARPRRSAMSSLQEFLAAREIWEVPLAASVVAGALLGVRSACTSSSGGRCSSPRRSRSSPRSASSRRCSSRSGSTSRREHASEQLAVAIGVLGRRRARSSARSGRGASPPRRASARRGCVASALVVLGASRARARGARPAAGMVFGNAVAVPAADLAVIAVVAALCTAVHSAFAKELAFTSFDPETAQALGMPRPALGRGAVPHDRRRHPAERRGRSARCPSSRS